MNEKTKISVVMPVYNTDREYLIEAIESILNQTFSNFEFIILNDGSTNNSKDIILSYNDHRIKYFENEKNQGIIYTLNKGLSLCAGEYIARMDSDDISIEQRFEKQIKVLDANPQIGIVGSWIKLFPSQSIVRTKEYPKYLDLLKENVLAHPTVMFRKSIMDLCNLKYENYLYCEDYELWTRMSMYTQIYNIQEVLLNYRVHKANISVVNNKRQSEIAKQIQKNMLDFLTKDKFLQNKIIKLINNKSFYERIKGFFRKVRNKLWK